MIEKKEYTDVNIVHSYDTRTAAVYDKNDVLLFTLTGYMFVGWYLEDCLFINNVARVALYPTDGKEYYSYGGYNLYHRSLGMLIAQDMQWINDSLAGNNLLQSCDCAGNYGLINIMGNTVLPFIFDKVTTFEYRRHPQVFLYFQISTSEYIYFQQGCLYPSPAATDYHINYEEHYYRNSEKMYTCLEVVVKEQSANGLWRFVAYQYIDDMLVFEYATGYIYKKEPDTSEISAGIEIGTTSDENWQFPTVDEETINKFRFHLPPHWA